jgi:hypothetical protein
MANKIFTPEKIVKYAEKRLFSDKDMPDGIGVIRPEMVNRIELHNGVLPSGVEDIVRKDYLLWGMGETDGKYSFWIKQSNAREPMFYDRGTLLIPQYSGFGRRERYEAMIKAYIEASGREIEFASCELNGDARKTNIEYDNFAYDFVVGLFVPDDKYEDRRVCSGFDIKDITTIIFGKTQAVAKQAKAIAKGNSEYLDCQIVQIDGKPVLNIGYVYADQAGIIIDKMLREYDALAKKEGNKLDIDIFMFGKMGGLEESMKRHDLIFPTGIVDEIALNQDTPVVYPMHNILASGQNISLNVRNVVNETTENLQKAEEAGCSCVEMEAWESIESINRARRRYADTLSINFGFAGHLSDLPLKGDTLADELESDKGEQDAVRTIVDKIRA